MNDEYYVQNSRQYVGNDILWWRKGWNGYTCNIEEAHVFTIAEAISVHNTRPTDVPWPKDYIDARTTKVIDIQDVRRKDVDDISQLSMT